MMGEQIMVFRATTTEIAEIMDSLQKSLAWIRVCSGTVLSDDDFNQIIATDIYDLSLIIRQAIKNQVEKETTELLARASVRIATGITIRKLGFGLAWNSVDLNFDNEYGFEFIVQRN